MSTFLKGALALRLSGASRSLVPGIDRLQDGAIGIDIAHYILPYNIIYHTIYYTILYDMPYYIIYHTIPCHNI